VHQVEEAVGATIHSITSRGAESRPKGGRRTSGEAKWVIHTPESAVRNGAAAAYFSLPAAKGIDPWGQRMV
jgi:hypothetical protein